MRLTFFYLIGIIISFLFVSAEIRAAACPCSAPSRSMSQAGKTGIENRIYQIRSEDKPLSASMRLGGLYDSRVGAASSLLTEGQEDWAIAATLAAGWQVPIEGDFGLRLDYVGYMNFYRDYDEYNVIDQTLFIEPQYVMGDFFLSLPMGFNPAVEDTKTDYLRYSLSPTVTYYMAGLNQAFALNGTAAFIDDQDDIAADEDGRSFGAGAAYLFFFGERSRLKLSFDYLRTQYDARLIDYLTGTDSPIRRKDDVFSSNIDILYNFTEHIGVFAGYTYMVTSSNVDVYDYHRNLVEGGIAWRY